MMDDDNDSGDYINLETRLDADDGLWSTGLTVGNRIMLVEYN